VPTVPRGPGDRAGFTPNVHPLLLALAAAGLLVATCPTSGQVIRVERGGTAETLAVVGRGANPIVAHPDGDSVIVGFGTQERDQLLQGFIDGRPTEVVADGLPLPNWLGFGPDGPL